MTRRLVREYPRSTRQVLSPVRESYLPHGIVVDSVPIPVEAIRRIYISKEAFRLLSIEGRKVISKEVLAQLAQLTVPSELPQLRTTKFGLYDEVKIRRTKVSKEHGRVLPLALAELFVDGRIFNTAIFGKGVLLSGRMYLLSEENLKKTSNIFSTIDPLGFYGLKDAKREVEVSQLLIQNGAYNSLSLGYIELNIVELRNFINEYWKPKFPKIAQKLQEQLDIVINNGDKPAYLFRLSAVSSRLNGKNIPREYVTDPKDKRGIKIRRSEIIKGVKIWEKELSSNQSRLNKPFKINENELHRVFNLIKNREELVLSDLEILKKYVLNLLYSDFQGLVNLIKKDKKYKNLLHYYFCVKDRDYALRAYDFEDHGHYKEEDFKKEVISWKISYLVYTYIIDVYSAISNKWLSEGFYGWKKEKADKEQLDDLIQKEFQPLFDELGL